MSHVLILQLALRWAAPAGTDNENLNNHWMLSFEGILISDDRHGHSTRSYPASWQSCVAGIVSPAAHRGMSPMGAKASSGASGTAT